MARVHVWEFLLNDTGQPIGGADISIYKAGTETPAYIYEDEYGGSPINVDPNTGEPLAPQLTTLKNGYFEFWISDGDESEETNKQYGYDLFQKFKIAWNKTGVASGYIDFIEVFNETKKYGEVDITDNNAIKNKLVSNYLANQWSYHSNLKIPDSGFISIHGLLQLDPTDTGTTQNKLLSNNQAYKWETHVDTLSVSEAILSAGPHGIEPVDETSTDDIKNKLVSNNQMKQLTDSKVNITTATLLSGSSWTSATGYYWTNVDYEGTSQYPIVQVWDMDTKYLNDGAAVFDVLSVSAGRVQIRCFSSEKNAVVKILDK